MAHHRGQQPPIFFMTPQSEGIVVNLRDVTERKKARGDLKESEERLRILFECAPDSSPE